MLIKTVNKILLGSMDNSKSLHGAMAILASPEQTGPAARGPASSILVPSS